MWNVTEDLRSCRFDPAAHDVEGFSCGEVGLDAWLREHAAVADRRRTSRTWVWVDDQDRVRAYFALVAHVVARGDVPSRVGRGGPAEIPAVLLAKLALDVTLQGKGLGSLLVADALERVLVATDIVGARLVVVDALSPDLAGFYERMGFRRIPDSLLLVQKVADLRAAHDDAQRTS